LFRPGFRREVRPDQLIKPNASVVLGKPFFNGADAKQTTTKNEPGGATLRDPPFDGAATDRIAGDEAFDVDHWLYVHTPIMSLFGASGKLWRKLTGRSLLSNLRS